MKTTLNPDWDNYELTHKHGGDGLVIVQELGDDMCRVAFVDRKGIGSRAFLAWKKLLSPALRSPGKNANGDWKPPVKQPLNPEQIAARDGLKQDLKTGRLVVRCQHIVEP